MTQSPMTQTFRNETFSDTGIHGPVDHVAVVNHALSSLMSGELGVDALMLLMPPRHAKTTLVSQDFARRVLQKDRNAEILAMSYSQAISSNNLAQIGPDATPHNYRAREYFASVTGFYPSLILLDDVIKDVRAISSAELRKRFADYFFQELLPRLASGGKIVLSMSRWHKDDLAGLLLQESEAGGLKWGVLRFPALLPVTDETPYYAPLWPERYSVSDYLRIKEAVAPELWDSLYMQAPPGEADLLRQIRQKRLVANTLLRTNELRTDGQASSSVSIETA